MNRDQFLASLASRLPSERMLAAQWAMENKLEPEFERVLTEALSRESVPRIQNAISLAINAIRSASGLHPEETAAKAGSESEIAGVLNELAGMIRHEMQPAIGWVRLAAHKELTDFQASATNRAIEALRRRVDGLANLAAAHRLPVRQIVSLSEAITGCLSDEYPSSMFKLEGSDQPSDEIYTDRGLLDLILANAIQNAADASRDIPNGQGHVLISTSIDGSRFWVTISNRFSGASFKFSSVAASGRTSKQGHRGLGTQVIQLAADRLGYEFELRAAGGTATFSLRGSRYE
ncbi:GHKL domain-containing protein [Arthrobacter sp. NPDC056691]|uniref:GHKL domain-containing protein n=1 Tax=Arthrobacter sp. NPDC056691 TaxID=3345913 RepID=UPI00366B90B4